MKFIPWKYLVGAALDAIAEFLIPRLRVNKHIAAFMGLSLDFGEASLERLTDGDTNNAAQMEALFVQKSEALLSTLLAGVIALVKNAELKKRIAAILLNAVAKLEEPTPTV